MNMSLLFRLLCASFLLASFGAVHGAVLGVGDKLSIEFQMPASPTFANTPDTLHLIVDGMTFNFTGSSATLFDGAKQLGAYTPDLSRQMYKFPISGLPFASNIIWGTAENLLTSFTPTIVNFNSILNRSIDGRILFEIPTGKLNINLNNPNSIKLMVVRSVGPMGVIDSGVNPTITNISLVSTVPESTPAVLLIFGLIFAVSRCFPGRFANCARGDSAVRPTLSLNRIAEITTPSQI
jgi:hypothetical protein